jgi:hypothetical protein
MSRAARRRSEGKATREAEAGPILTMEDLLAACGVRAWAPMDYWVRQDGHAH